MIFEAMRFNFTQEVSREGEKRCKKRTLRDTNKKKDRGGAGAPRSILKSCH